MTLNFLQSLNLILVSFKSTDGLECQFISNLD